MIQGRPSSIEADRFRALHRGPAPLVLANVWDAASAVAVVEAGMRAIATSSGAMAQALGYSDGEKTPVDEMFAAIGRIVRAVGNAADNGHNHLLVSADIESGYGLSTHELVERLAAVGVVGCNVEDSNPQDHLMVPAEEQAARISTLRDAAAEAGTGLVINARVDLHVRSDGPESTRLRRSIARAQRFLEAGADCVFPILMTSDADIATYVREVPGPVNIMATQRTPGLRRLAELGVARVSYGSGFHRIAMTSFRNAVERVKAGYDPWGA